MPCIETALKTIISEERSGDQTLSVGCVAGEVASELRKNGGENGIRIRGVRRREWKSFSDGRYFLCSEDSARGALKSSMNVKETAVDLKWLYSRRIIWSPAKIDNV